MVDSNSNPSGENNQPQGKKKTYSQDWRAYSEAQKREQEIFPRLLRELCDTIEQPLQTTGRARLPLSDMVYAGIMKVNGLRSARRSMTSIVEAQERDHLDIVPCFTSIMGYLRKPEMTDILQSLIELSAQPLAVVELDFAVDSSGFGTVSYQRWFDAKWGRERKKAKYMNAHIMAGVKTNVITAAEVFPELVGDSTRFQPLLNTTAERFTIREVSADKAYLSKKNLVAAADMGVTTYIPFKKNATPAPVKMSKDPQSMRESALWRKAFYYYHYREDDFKKHYHKRSNVETTFWMVKSKFGASVRSKNPVGQVNEVLAKFLCHNITVLIASMFELGVVPVFDAEGLLNKSQS